MRAFAKPTPIGRLSVEARIVYTGFCLFMLLGYLSSAWLYLDDDLGVRPADTARYYLGESTDAASVEDDGGPALELPDEPVANEDLRLEKPARQVMETFHFHLFTMPVCLLIVAHIFMMCGIETRQKVWWIALATLSTFVHLITPLLVRFGSPSFAPLMFPSAAVMGVTWLYLTTRPVFEMWRRPQGVGA